MSFSRNSPAAGFTLLETVIAIAIMVLALSTILAAESGSINASARAKQMNVVAMLAKNKMVETEYAFEGKTFDEFKKEDHGIYPEPFQDYQWKTEVKEVEFPDIDLTAAVSGGGSSGSGGGANSSADNSDAAGMMTKAVSNYLSKALRQVTVTVLWKRGGGEQTFELTTYWVDLNHEFDFTP